MNKPTIDHVLLTRFNVPTPGRESLIRAQDGWLRNRVELFEKYCAPSVEAQSDRNFHWLIYFDPDSPQWLMDWLESGTYSHLFRAAFRSSISNLELVSDLSELSGAQRDVLLTTNLDNDDGLAIDFVARSQSAVATIERTAIYLTRGLILNGSKTYWRIDPSNAFCSVAESWESPVTAWADWHNRLGLAMAVKEIPGAPAWLQVIHGLNVSNRVHGRLIKPSEHSKLFAYALPRLPDPAASQIFVENYLAVPLRSVYSAARTLAKTALLKVLGKDGFNEFKNRATNFGAKTTSTPKLLSEPANPLASPHSETGD